MRRRPNPRRTKKKKREVHATFKDWENREVVLYKHTLTKHIFRRHPDLLEPINYIREALKNPTSVVRDRFQPNKYLVNHKLGPDDKAPYFLVVITKRKGRYEVNTGYLLDKPKKGKRIWPKKSQ